MSKYVTGGVSKNASGQFKVRGSTLSIIDTVERQTRAGNTDILFVDLPRAMERDEIAAYLLTLPEFESVKTLLEATLAKQAPRTAKAAKTPKAAAQPKTAKTKSPKVTPGVTQVRMGKKVTVSEAEAVPA